MRLSELAGKEMIDMQTGTKVGVLGGADLWVNEETGQIDSILLASSGFSFGKRREETVIPWSAVVKIGPDMIILDSQPAPRVTRHSAHE
ncbi:YlmC/YmxH family sporulation protein [Tumebacillus permanentifrigoris]|uniref:YlmC/YmxH family sporulation protein n=1 Tax=Tumebacillus permanentifrigoris TaxID=378543 RepID=A0A316D7V2_9BACL|nr:YlmC/YmxH family sporulation protein [Tumebacillus permanentifrigoris]PWK12657.1 YlmC/YmxH family sporulation protein [Tumebacillus permanentifrigoris]